MRVGCRRMRRQRMVSHCTPPADLAHLYGGALRSAQRALPPADTGTAHEIPKVPAYAPGREQSRCQCAQQRVAVEPTLAVRGIRGGREAQVARFHEADIGEVAADRALAANP